MNNDLNDMAQDMQDRIRELAYLMWESAGRQHGMAMEYWTAAEHELRATMEAATARMTPPTARKAEAKPAAPAAKAPAAKPAAPAAKPTAPSPAGKKK